LSILLASPGVDQLTIQRVSAERQNAKDMMVLATKRAGGGV